MKSKLPSLLERIKQLIAIPSISSLDAKLDIGNHKVNLLLANWLDDLGFDIHIQQLDERKSNLIATLNANSDGTSGLVLSGHTDTVPVNDEIWSVNPFGSDIIDGKLYGLGSCDMKSFFSLIIETLASRDLKKIVKPIMILATADEETTMLGAKRFADLKMLTGGFALIGEPTNLKPIRMHKGVMMETITVHGKAGHASQPNLGENAIEGMNIIIQMLIEWRQKLQLNYKNANFEIGIPTLNFGSIHGGDCANRICESCVLSLDIRLLPGMEISMVREMLLEILDQGYVTEGIKTTHSTGFTGIPAFEMSRSDKFVQLMESITCSSSGSVSFGTEASYFQSLGLSTIIYGVGNISQAHQPNEYIQCKDFEVYNKNIGKLIDKICYQ